ncbi:MAG: DNA translocase FtsK [Myxococcales bacterium]|nr:DNA translocase FtsK [Myxococcales bacterium]
MNEQQLLGATAAALVRKTIGTSESTSRIMLEQFPPYQLLAIVEAVRGDVTLASTCALRVPRSLDTLSQLPPPVLTDAKAVFWRNVPVDESVRAVLIGYDDDEQRQSLHDLPTVGSAQLLADPALWVESAKVDLDPTDRKTWTVALRALQQSKSVSLDRFAAYVSAVRSALVDEGMPIETALGYALPALQLPRDRSYFAGVAASSKGQLPKWLSYYKKLFRQRAPYLLKRHATEQPIEASELRANLAKVRDTLDPRIASVVEAFVEAPPVWSDAVKAFAELDWEQDNARTLFENLRKKKQKVGAATVDLFETRFPTSLTAEESRYLEGFDARGSRDPDEEDQAFYEQHRFELEIDPRLKIQWDRFVYGKSIDTDDLRVGLLKAVERLFNQIEAAPYGRVLTIECDRQNAKRWAEVNKHAAHYFALRYRGLKSLFGHDVVWKPDTLFDDAIAEIEVVAGKKVNARDSVAKAANQVKFTVSLAPRGKEDDAASIQVSWQFDPRTIEVAFASDWKRLREHPFATNTVTRETVSAKGRMQTIDLRDVQTLMPSGQQLRGGLVYRTKTDDLDKRFVGALAEGLHEQWFSQDAHDAILADFTSFAGAYRQAIKDYQVQGTAARSVFELGRRYSELLDALVTDARSDKARRRLWRLVSEIGVADVKESEGAAIVAPWHPLRLVAAATSDRRLGGLVRYVLREPEVEFGDIRLFFRDLESELEKPFYPEVCVGYRRDEAVLLAATDHVGDYSLMEPATREAHGRNAGREETHDDPRVPARVLRDVVRQFLELYPHEAANLSVVLFNCDSAGLPEATVSMLSEMHGEDDEQPVRCHVQLRHEWRERLQALYESLLESSARDTESAVASEASRDFMARLRVGIMAGPSGPVAKLDGPAADIVFLHDVVARLCTVHWSNQPDTMVAEDGLRHVPGQWSRRRPPMPNDLHSATDLTCPMQTPSGWSYLRLVRGLTDVAVPNGDAKPLPSRHVRFDSGEAKAVLEDAHRTGLWVVNYDPILTRQHLHNLDIRVIRHRRAVGESRGVIVSSTASLNMLHTLVRRNLERIALDLPSEDLVRLAEKLVRYASEVSGDIVLRAARRSAFAHELIGVALSRYLLEDELARGGDELAQGWYFLDDYAEWLGAREGHLADILALRVERTAEGKTQLVALVSEAKYVTAEIVHEQRAHSGKQTEQTLLRMESALFSTPQRLDRDQWLGRLSDLLAASVVSPQVGLDALQTVQRDVAAGQVEILLRGYSHVFVYAKSPEYEVSAGRERLSRVEHGWQETYGPDLVRLLLKAFHRWESPRAVRARLDDERPWDEGRAKPTAEGANWATSLATMAFEPPPVAVPVPPPALPTPPTKAPKGTKAAAPKAEPTVVVPPADDPFAWATPRVAEVLRTASSERAEDGLDDKAWLESTVTQLTGALRGYKLQAKLIDARLTPNAALVRYQGSDLLTVQAVEQKLGALLTTHALRVLTPQAEPGAIVLLVERPSRQKLSFASVLAGRRVSDPGSTLNTQLVVGVRERDGETLYLDPANRHNPHTLIAGTTGSGKSVLLQNLILDIAMTNAPAEATITLIDPKQGVDYQGLDTLPHLESGIITQQDEARARLEALVEEMDERYRLFASAGRGVNKLSLYNRKVAAADRLPVRWVIHDEFADWMLVDAYKDAVSKLVQRLGVKARAAGIYLVFAAQRPDNQVMPMQLRNNLGNRLILRVADEGTSMIALKEKGAERLLGRGHLAASLEGEGGLQLGQVPILEADTMAALIDAISLDVHQPQA